MTLFHYEFLYLSGKLHTAAGANHGAHHWYPDLEFHKMTYGEGVKVRMFKYTKSIATIR